MFSPAIWGWLWGVLQSFVVSVAAGLVTTAISKWVSQHEGSWFRWPRFSIGFGVILVPLFCFYIVPRYPPEVPSLAEGNITLSEATTMVSARGLSLRVTRQFMAIPEKDRVAQQDPREGRVAKGGKIAVTVSAGPYPQVVSSQEALAVAELHRAGLEVSILRIPSLTQARGVVTRQEPENGEDLHPGDKVTITVSRGLPPQRVEIRGVRRLPGDEGDGEVTVRVCGFPEGSVVLAWVEEPNEAYYPQERAEFHYPDPDVAMPQEYHLRLRYAFRAPPADKLVRLTVHPPGCALSSVTVFRATHRNYLLVSAGPLQFQLEREGYNPLAEAAPRSVHSDPPPDRCRCNGETARQ